MEKNDARGLQLAGLSKRFGGAGAVERVELDVADGEFVTLLGPSGCGKTTTIRMIAGYIAPTTGTIVLGGKDVTDLPPQKRRMGMVFQDYALFPHLNNRDNVAFGLRMQGVGKRDRRKIADEKLELVGLGQAGDKYPSQLSGGMRQRVALARALAIDPQVLLLDEPFSALDAKLRHSLRAEVKRVQQVTGVTTLLVTHDQQEALGISDRIVVMRQGNVEQVGTPQEIYAKPTSAFVLDFVGRSTAVQATVAERGPREGLITCRAGDVTIVAVDPGVAPGQQVTLAVRPENVDVTEGANADGQNRFAGKLEAIEFAGNEEHATVRVDAFGKSMLSDLECEAAGQPRRWSEGDAVVVSFDPEDVIVLPDAQAGESSAQGAPVAAAA